jgi:DNA-binding transcriptional LysR family regulator
MSFSVDDLRAFTLVSHERSVSRAALAMGVAQQSVSERIRRLERRLGVELFVRLPHGMSPSTAGYRLLPYAHRTLSLVDEALAVLADDSVVRVRVQRSVAARVVPVVRETLSGFTLDVVEEPDAEQVLAAVANGLSDVALGSFPASWQAPTPREHGDGRRSGEHGERSGLRLAVEEAGGLDMAIERAFDDPVVCVATPDHALAGRSGLRLEDLMDWGVAVAPPLGGRGPFGGRLDTEDHVLPGEPAAALCTRSSVTDELVAGRLVELDVRDLPAWVVPIHVAYRATDRERPFLAALRAAFRDPAGATAGGSTASAHAAIGQECA